MSNITCPPQLRLQSVKLGPSREAPRYQTVGKASSWGCIAESYRYKILTIIWIVIIDNVESQDNTWTVDSNSLKICITDKVFYITSKEVCISKQ